MGFTKTYFIYICTDNPITCHEKTIMITMKKTIMLVLLLLLPLVGATAQGEVRKKRVFVEYFEAKGNFQHDLCEPLRSVILSGLAGTGRVDVIDVAAEASLANEEARRGDISALGDPVARTQQIVTLGADYILMGAGNSVSYKSKTDDKGKTLHYATVVATVKAVDASTGKVIAVMNPSKESIGKDTQQEALSNAIASHRSTMRQFVDDAFPLRGTLLQLDEVKGDKAKTCYIDLGSASGLVKGDRMDVFVEKDIVGEKTLQLVGSLKTQEVLSGTRAKCSVTKGEKEILKLMNEGAQLTVKTRAERSFFSSLPSL